MTPGVTPEALLTASPTDEPTAPAWWTSAVVYQVYPRSFADSDGDGTGDLRGIIRRLPHLVRLGVDVVWLSPVYASPQVDNGYDISDYEAIDPVFGTMADLDELIAGLHEHGMKLVIDLVVNHTSDEHAWFVDSASSRTSPRRDWYWWRPPRPGHIGGQPGAEPTNWESLFSGPAWQWDEKTGEYYLHLFDRKQPDLNWENLEVRSAIHAMMRRWLDRGVDGFRMDVINFISKPVRADGSLPDAPAGPSGMGDAVALVANGPRLDEYLAEMHAAVWADREGQLLTVGEMPAVTADQARLITDPRRRELDMVFQFEHVELDHGPGGKFDLRPLDLAALKASLGRWQSELADVGWNSLYWCNHDRPRVVSRWGDTGRWWRESATAWATVLHLMRGTPFVYQGEELGMTSAPIPKSLDEVEDVEARRYAQTQLQDGQPLEDVLTGIGRGGRDNARTPMQWDASQGAGFSTGRPWLPVNPNHAWLNAEAEYDDEESVFNHYRRLIGLRHDLGVVAVGSFQLLLADDPRVFAYERRLGHERLLVVANLSADAVDAPVGAEWTDAELLLTNQKSGRVTPGSDGLSLAPWEAVVLHRN